jgi:branched-chain amino acid aminotransferase
MKGIEIIENTQRRTKVAYTACEFWDYEYGLAHKFTTVEVFLKALEDLKDGVEMSSFFVELDLVKSQITYEYARYLETCGIVISAFTENYQYGSFALDYLKETEVSEHVLLRFCRLTDTFKIITEKPTLMHKEHLAKNGFNNIYALNQIISICQKKDDTYVWSAPIIVPDGMHVASPFTVTEQYGQSCFEGMVSMAGKDNTMVVLRPKDNAKRLQISGSSIGIPEISEEIFEKSIEYVLKANLPFMPETDDNFRIYLRPYLKGLEGGYGVGPADTFVFCIQIFPYGNFVGLKDSALDIIAFEEYRRSHEGGFGSKKVSGNYAQTIVVREEVKKGIAGKTYNDVFFLGMKHQTAQLDGKEVIITENVLDEDAAGNLMVFKMENDQIQLVTPPLKRKAFLGGFTRDTILQLAENLGYQTSEKELKFEELSEYDGAFLTGSAVGMAKIRSMTYQDKCIEFYKNTKATEFFEHLYDRFYELRKGELDIEALRHLTTFYKIRT